MRALIVEHDTGLSGLWARHLGRHGFSTRTAATLDQAFDLLRTDQFGVIILDLMLQGDAALAVSDYASVIQPEAQVILVTNTSFFSDGSIFRICTNARAFVPADTAPEDLANMAEHYARSRVAPQVGLSRA